MDLRIPRGTNGFSILVFMLFINSDTKKRKNHPELIKAPWMVLIFVFLQAKQIASF
jgi:hypothetical protein